MPISGPSSDTKVLLKKLDESSLVELVADILARRGHAEIKIMDGPGDGCRDIHSLNAERVKHLTQCKHRLDPSKTVSSKETGELPLGLTKLGYGEGLFITNAAMSPQAKREYLDDYPSLNMEFIEGAELAPVVLDDVVLRALWFDGEKVDRVSYDIVVPIIARDMARDQPLLLDPYLSGGAANNLKVDVPEGEMTAQLVLRKQFVYLGLFQPYRSPKVRTMSEPWLPQAATFEARVSGAHLLVHLSSVLSSLERSIMESLRAESRDVPSHVAVRFGIPYVTCLDGGQGENRIELERGACTFILYNGHILSEREWFLPQEIDGWTQPDGYGVRATTADWVRWYCAELDSCLDLNLISCPDEAVQHRLTEQAEYFVKWWNKSLFALIPRDVRLEQDASVDEGDALMSPSWTEEWWEKKRLCAWLHGNLGPGFRSILMAPEVDAEESSPRWGVDEKTAERAYELLSKRILEEGGEVVDPGVARHMFAVKGRDPFPPTDTVCYRSIEVMFELGSLPSPVDPRSRIFEFTTCWRVSDSGDQEDDETDLLSSIRQVVAPSKIAVCERLFIDRCVHSRYLVMYFSLFDLDLSKPTSDILSTAARGLGPLLGDIDTVITNKLGESSRSTRQFWWEEIGLLYGDIESAA